MTPCLISVIESKTLLQSNDHNFMKEGTNGLVVANRMA